MIPKTEIKMESQSPHQDNFFMEQHTSTVLQHANYPGRKWVTNQTIKWMLHEQGLKVWRAAVKHKLMHAHKFATVCSSRTWKIGDWPICSGTKFCLWMKYGYVYATLMFAIEFWECPMKCVQPNQSYGRGDTVGQGQRQTECTALHHWYWDPHVLLSLNMYELYLAIKQ